MKRQAGQLYVTARGAIRLKYFRTEIENGAEVRKRKDVLLCEIDERHTAEKRGDKWVFSNAVLSMKDRVMLDVNDRADAFAQPVAKINHRTIAGFYTEVYSEWAFRELRKRTMRGYCQIWKSRLKDHFGTMTFLDYTTLMASKYLTSLAEEGLSAKTIAHIRALASGIFKHALAHHGLITVNPWDNAASARKYTQAPPTEFYAATEARAIIGTFKTEQPAWATLFGLCFYGGLRPSEAVAVRYEDFEQKDGVWFLKIERGFVDNTLDETKTAGSKAVIPVARQLFELVQALHAHATVKTGWLFPGELGKKPIDLHNLYSREMKPAFVEKGLDWRGLYAFRRGAATHLKGLGDVMGAQALLRHAHPNTTEQHYAKLTSADQMRAVKFLEDGAGA